MMRYEVQTRRKQSESEFNTMIETFPYDKEGREQAIAHLGRMRKAGHIAELRKTMLEG